MNPMTLNKDFEKQLDFYPYGVQYYRAPTPLPEEWEADLDEIARIGYTHVQYRPQWRWHQKVLKKRPWTIWIVYLIWPARKSGSKADA